jgi:hypothetical protein
VTGILEERRSSVQYLHGAVRRQREGNLKRGGGMTEMPVVTSCAHGGHLLGGKCLRHWLETNDSCPLCRDRLLPLGATKAEFEASEDAAVANQKIPEWVITLLGKNPSE